jgi:hypothetical protein
MVVRAKRRGGGGKELKGETRARDGLDGDECMCIDLVDARCTPLGTPIVLRLKRRRESGLYRDG